jgi:hypothetical protein
VKDEIQSYFRGVNPDAPLPCPAPLILDRFFATILNGNRKTQAKMAWTQDFEQANTISKNGAFGKV